MSLPYVVKFRGLPACPCLATWIPAYEAELQRRGLLTGPIRLYQLIGGAPASGGTHTQGGAYDTAWIGEAAIWVARQMGADATWHRPHNWDGAGGMEHVHGVLTGCPHNGPARYQIDAVRAGYNGLGHLGHGAPDTGPRPLSGRTWQQGMSWARTQLQEDDMPFNDWPQADKDALAAAVWQAQDKDGHHRGATLYGIYKLVVAIAKKVGA